MGKMISLFEEASIGAKRIGQLSPDLMRAWHNFMDVTEGKGALSLKEKELIAISLAINSMCDWCIVTHVKKALELGANQQEILEAAWTSVFMGGDPSLMYAQIVVQALEEFGDLRPEEPLFFGPGLKNDEVDGKFQKLYIQLKDYVETICNKAEALYDENSDRINFALKVAEEDGDSLESLVIEECENRRWETPSESKSS
jgi:AhpD family alkylhydroperoxidase